MRLNWLYLCNCTISVIVISGATEQPVHLLLLFIKCVGSSKSKLGGFSLDIFNRADSHSFAACALTAFDAGRERRGYAAN